MAAFEQFLEYYLRKCHQMRMLFQAFNFQICSKRGQNSGDPSI